MNDIKKILYEEGYGLFEKMRDGNYEISIEEKRVIIDFAKQFNKDMKRSAISTEEVGIALDLVHTMAGFKEEEPELLASEVYGIMLKNIKFTD